MMQKENFGAAATYTTDYGEDFPEENKYPDKESIYKEDSKDPSILTLGLPDDQVFQDAYDSLNQTNVATIAEVKTLIDSGYTSAAVSLNNSISPANVAEANSKAVHELIVAFKATDSLSSAQKEQGHSIAIQTALEGGLDVYLIRAILNEDIVDDIDASAARKGKSENGQQTKLFYGTVFPNPAKDQITYACSINNDATGIIKVTDVLGKPILISKIENGISVLNTSTLAPGVYYYNSIFKDGLKQAGWFTIVR